MSVTLHWWMIPIALVLIGVVWLMAAGERSMSGVVALWVCLFMAIAFTVGHFV